VRYLLEALDEEMAAWKAKAAVAGQPFAEWLRRAARAEMEREVGRGDAREDAGSASTKQVLGTSRSTSAPERIFRDDLVKTFHGPDPKPGKK
jgi:hypothetical protein